MLKRLFLFVCVYVFISGGSIAFADDAAYELGFYTISDKEIISQNDDKVVISFKITNNTDNYYPELFCVPTLKLNGDEDTNMFYFPYYDYEASEFSLEPKESKTISLDCHLPSLPNKKAIISLTFYSTTHRVSFISESFYLDKINPDFRGFLEGGLFSYWKLQDGSYIRSDSGPNVNSESLPQIYLNLKSTFEDDKKVYPYYEVYERSYVYNNKPIYTGYQDSISFKAGEEKEILLDVPNFVRPESYLIRLSFVDEAGVTVSNIYDYRYVIEGESAKVTKITLEKSEGKNLIKAYIYGSADRSDLENAQVDIEVYDKANILIGKSHQDNVLLGQNEIAVSMVLDNILEDEVIVVVKVSKDGKELCEKSEQLNLEIDYTDKNELFTDIEGSNCEQAVRTLNGLGIISGYPDNTFKPENLVTRAEFSTIVTKLKELEAVQDENSLFSDTSGHWAVSYINTIYKNGFVSGYPDGTFRPQNNVTYAETVTILLNSLGYKTEVNNSELSWPHNYIQKAIDLELNKNVDISNYSMPATRGDIALLTLQAYLLK